MLNYKAFFILKNHDEADQISVVATGEQHIVGILERFIELSQVIGTNGGAIYQIHAQTSNIVKKIQPHNRKITNVVIKENSAIISSSHDGFLVISFLTTEFEDMRIDLQELELSCFCLKSSFNPSQIEFFIGTCLGKLFYFYNGWLQNTKEVIHNNQTEGPITNVTCFNDIVAWSTPQNIRVIHYSKKQKICLIERPKKSDNFPDYLYNASATKPAIIWRRDEAAG